MSKTKEIMTEILSNKKDPNQNPEIENLKHTFEQKLNSLKEDFNKNLSQLTLRTEKP